MVMSQHGTTPLTIGVVLIIFVMGLLFSSMFFNVFSNDDRKRKEDIYLVVTVVKNDSSLPKTVETGDKTFTIAPGESSRITVPSNAVLTTTATNHDGSKNSHKITLDSTKRTGIVHLTDSTVSTNFNTKLGSLINESTKAVKFVEVGKDGKRWPKGFVGPKSNVDNVTIPVSSTWQVVDPERSDIVLGSVKVSIGTRKLIYDGEGLIERK
jgi:hypothetical protein